MTILAAAFADCAWLALGPLEFSSSDLATLAEANRRRTGTRCPRNCSSQPWRCCSRLPSRLASPWGPISAFNERRAHFREMTFPVLPATVAREGRTHKVAELHALRFWAFMLCYVGVCFSSLATNHAV